MGELAQQLEVGPGFLDVVKVWRDGDGTQRGSYSGPVDPKMGGHLLALWPPHFLFLAHLRLSPQLGSSFEI